MLKLHYHQLQSEYYYKSPTHQRKSPQFNQTCCNHHNRTKFKFHPTHQQVEIQINPTNQPPSICREPKKKKNLKAYHDWMIFGGDSMVDSMFFQNQNQSFFIFFIYISSMNSKPKETGWNQWKWNSDDIIEEGDWEIRNKNRLILVYGKNPKLMQRLITGCWGGAKRFYWRARWIWSQKRLWKLLVHVKRSRQFGISFLGKIRIYHLVLG